MKLLHKCIVICLIPMFLLGGTSTPEISAVRNYEKLLSDYIGMDDLNELKSSADSLSKVVKKSNNPLELLKLAIVYHNLSNYGFNKGYRGYAEKSYKILSKLYKDSDVDKALMPFVLVYLGSSRALMGSESSNPAKKISYVKEGLKYLDLAAKRYYKTTYVVPLIRGNVCIAIPEFFKRTKTAWKDFRYLEKKYKEDKTSVPKGAICNAIFNLGTLYKKEGKIEEALTYWQKVQKMCPNSIVGKKAKALIEVYTE